MINYNFIHVCKTICLYIFIQSNYLPSITSIAHTYTIDLVLKFIMNKNCK